MTTRVIRCNQINMKAGIPIGPITKATVAIRNTMNSSLMRPVLRAQAANAPTVGAKTGTIGPSIPPRLKTPVPMNEPTRTATVP